MLYYRVKWGAKWKEEYPQDVLQFSEVVVLLIDLLKT